MKNLITSVAFLLSGLSGAHAQLTLESSNYPTLLKMVHLEHSGFKYALINHANNLISLYNLDHSLYKTINVPAIGLAQPGSWIVVQYITETLWDTDSTDIDYAALGQDTNGTNFIRVFHENGGTIFSRDSASFYFGIGQDFGNPISVPIMNTDSGTKMILWCGPGHTPTNLTSSSVYCLPGHLEENLSYSNACDGSINAIPSQQFSNPVYLSNPYPNPANNFTTIPFTLPETEKSGELILYNLDGNEVRRFRVDKTFDHLLLDNAQLPAGTYFYVLITSKDILGTKKLIIIK